MIPHNRLASYIRDLQKVYASGKATEHSYREALRELLAEAQDSLTVINEPKRIEVGAPDYIIERQGVPLGFVEAKDLIVDLDKLDRRSKEQLEDYRAALPNLIHTNYIHFRWYVGGDLREDCSLGDLRSGKIEIDSSRFDDVAGMLARFIEQVTPTIHSPEELARRMAAMTKQIAVLIHNSLPDSETLNSQMVSFETTLIPSLKPDEFADMYAQTLAYGLFAARVRYGAKAPEGFTLQNAFWNLPETNPFLRKFFQEIVPDLDERVRWQAETLASLLAHAKMDDILRDFGRRTRTEDPVVHFYETFLREYDPAKREQRGVYYTPEPVVSYIVRSVDHLLRTRFGRDGLADKDTLILDPATGTGTFLYFVIQQIYEQMAGQRGTWNQYVKDNLLKRLFGFELLMAPYAVAHMKLGIQLQETGYSFGGGQRLGVYLTNTLEEVVKMGEQQFAQFINQEANEATAIKRDKKIMVVLGNPPYSGHSANKGEWITKLHREYYFVDGQPLGERNSKWLQNDYIKFIRFGQWRINQTGSGILAFITDNSYLDSPTMRGMRQQLMQSFDDIYILNLHGNSNKKEKTPEGHKDENVFDIQQGVAIAIFVKNVGSTQPAQIHYADLWGLREAKYKALLAQDVSETHWETLSPTSPYYLFVPQTLDLKAEYEAGWKISEAFGTGNQKVDSGRRYALGIITHNDLLHIGWTKEELIERISLLANVKISDSEAIERLPIEDSPYWKTARERETVRNSNWETNIWPVYYRPFDWRYIYYEPDLMENGRGGASRNVMRWARQSELNLMVSRGYEVRDFEHILVADNIAVHHAATRKEGNYFFPLYFYPDPNDKKLIEVEGDWPPGKDGRTPNLSKKFIQDMESKLGLTFVSDGKGDLETTFGPEDVFNYAYAVFHSPTYRERYAEFLKIDFPRLPITSDKKLFRDLCVKGAALVELHLLRGDGVKHLITTFPASGDNQVISGYPRYTVTPLADGVGHPLPQGEGEQEGRVYINKTQYFGGIEAEIWDFHVGGYQVLEKWLKDRRGRTLTYEDIQHYQQVVVALAHTIELMEQIDERIPAWPII